MPTSQKVIWIGLGVTAIAILALGYFLFLAPQRGEKNAALPETSSLPALSQETTPRPAAGVDPDISPLDLDLDHSDAAVRKLVADQEIPVVMKKWLQQKDIVRTVVAAVDNIARGESLAAQLPFLAPVDTFAALEKNGVYAMDPRSYGRYDPLVTVFTSIADETWVWWYKKLSPTLEKAFKELGFPGVTFSQRVQQAIDQLTGVPPLQQEVALEKKIVSFAFADANLEALNPAQKHLLRLGPLNTARIQNKLRALASKLKFSK